MVAVYQPHLQSTHRRVFDCVSVSTISQTIFDLRTLKFEYDVVYKYNVYLGIQHRALSEQGQGHGVTSDFFSIYHITNY